MLTGDNRRTAAAVAKSLGLDAVEAEVEPAGKVAHVKISAGVYLRSDAEITGDHFDRARQQGLGPEPPRFSRRPFRLSHAAMASSWVCE